MSIFSLSKNVLDTRRRLLKIGNGTVLIYTMGKVGSSSIAESLDMGHQLHTLDSEPPAKYFSSRFTPYIRRQAIETQRWRMLNKKIHSRLRENINHNKEIKIISLSRDPIERNVSAYFQNLDTTQLDSHRYLSEEFMAYATHFVPLYWFDLEIKKYLNVDIFEFEFDSSAGYSIVQKDNISILLMQFEKLPTLSNYIAKFLGLDEFNLISDKKQGNVSSAKWYYPGYLKLKNELSFPKEFIDYMYTSKYVKHFYNCNQIESMVKKWQKN